MKASTKTKVRVLTQLFSETENPWRVIGITKNALEIFKENNFMKSSGMKINRSHIHNRNDSYTKMLKTKFEDAAEWWDFYYDKDETILATSSENMSSRFSKIIDIDNTDDLFKSSGYGWTHRKGKETPFLQKLAEKHIP